MPPVAHYTTARGEFDPFWKIDTPCRVFTEHGPKNLCAIHPGKVDPQQHSCVSIFFSDIVGFTDLAAKMDPLRISCMLDR